MASTRTSQPNSPMANRTSDPRRPAVARVVLASLLAALALMIAARMHVGDVFGWPTGSLTQSLWRLFVQGTLGQPADLVTVMDIRLLRVVLACAVGAALASSGVALQGLLRNPLAEPFILGLSSGAALGIMAQMTLSYRMGQLLGPSHLGALIGALISGTIVFLASRRRGMLDPLGLLLVGVVLSTINGAIIMLLNYMTGPAGMREDLARWMMGFLNESVSSRELLVVLAITLGGICVLAGRGRAMDVATFSDIEAQSMGVNLTRLRTLLFVVAGVLAAGSVVLAGPIAFVGLICPHFMRLLLGPGHRMRVISSAIAGAVLILAADIAAVALDFGQGRLPIGIFIAMLGGPVFLWILRPHLGRGM
jgi:iron complex transport system permease protein